MKFPGVESIGLYNSRGFAANGKTTKNRTLSMFEIELPIMDGGISYIESNFMHITPNMIICAKPGQVRHTTFPLTCYYIHFTLAKGYLYDTLATLPDFFETSKHKVYEEIFIKLCDYYNTYTKHDEIRVQSLILELIHTLYMDAKNQIHSKEYRSKSELIEKSLEYIKIHLTEDLSLQEVAQAVSLSPTYFHSIFKKALCKTLHEYVEEQRIKKAIHLLMTTEMKLTEIAYECGFSSQSYFSYVFKRKMNTTPRKYVQQLANRYLNDDNVI